MESYARALTYAIPVFLFLIGVEALWAWRKGIPINRGADMISSLTSGLSNILKDVLGLSIAVVGYTWLVQHVALFDIGTEWYVWVIAFIAKDFAGYWIHRMEHTINIFWNRHIIHHSSEEFNLSCALRQSISEVFSFVGLFLLPAAIIGVPSEVIAVIAPIQLFAQFWYHTRLIGKMGWFENVMVTPSHHRVHHAINAEYIDKNYGQVFIVWDKLFGTFQPERDDIPPVYGVKRPVHTWNPFLISIQHAWALLKDAMHAKHWKDKFLVWFKRTGWRPDDVARRYPLEVIEDVHHFDKYDTQIKGLLLAWSWTQLTIMLIMTMDLFLRFATIGFPGVLWYGVFLFLSIFSTTALMDRAHYAPVAEIIRLGLACYIYFSHHLDWFGLHAVWDPGPGVVMLYMIVAFGVTLYFHFKENKVFHYTWMKA